MTMEVIIRPEAEADMKTAFEWYEEQNSGLGSDFLLCADATFNRIARHPQQFQQLHKDIRRALTRRFPYQIFFIIEKHHVVVLAVLHAKRSPHQWRTRSFP